VHNFHQPEDTPARTWLAKVRYQHPSLIVVKGFALRKAREDHMVRGHLLNNDRLTQLEETLLDIGRANRWIRHS
jgi:hypothetical protein